MKSSDSAAAGQPKTPKLSHAVFVSHSSEDKPVADAVCAALESENIGCWMAPRDVQDGRSLSAQITQAIREARVLLLILSQAANGSKQVLEEVERAAHCRNHLLTFRIEAISPGDDLAYFLAADQRVDGFQPLPPSQHFPALIQRTRSLLQSKSAESGWEKESDANAPEIFAHFRILRHPDNSLFRLGKGGMGVTYKAIDTVLNRPVALKVITGEFLRSQQARHRFLREAQAAALIHHPHVATIFHFGEEGDTYFYAMEFIEGEDLERYVGRGGPLAPATALRVVLQVAQALEAAQARGLIHRDIKPGNIMAVANRAGSLDVKLIDFGLAKGAGSETLEAARITRTQDFVGSPAFASPEQCQTKKLDIRSDIYSLGVTLWYLLSGKRPFSGSIGEVMIAQVITPPPFDQLAHLPEPVLELLRRMLAKSPDDRFQTPQTLQDAVEGVAARLASDFGTVTERIVAEGVPRKNESADRSALQIDPYAPAEPLQLTTLASPIFDGYLGIEVGAVVASRYRLLEESREGSGGRFFLARDEETVAGEPSEVGLKLLHPGITADPALLDLLENETGVIRQATHPNLVRYFRLERSTPFVVREWIHGFLLYDLLRWRRSLNAAELRVLLGPLAATLDFVANNGLGLVDVSVRKILVACPKEITSEEFAALARGNAQDWNRCTLKLNPLSLAPLLFRSRNGWDRQTVVPTSRVLSMTQAEAGIRGSKAVRLYGRLVYELLSGRVTGRNNSRPYTPLPELDQAGNETLRRACVANGSGAAYRTCQEFWNALQENIAAGGRPASVPVSTPATPPSVLPQTQPVPTPKRRLMVWAVLGGALTIALAIFGTIRFGGSGTTSVVTPIPSVASITATPTPVVLVTPTPSIAIATPIPGPTASSSSVAVATQTPAATATQNLFHSDANQVILSLLPQMPKQGGYSESDAATANLQSAVSVSSGHLILTPGLAVPSFSSGATYLVFVKAVEKLNGGAPIASPLAEQLAVKGQSDGVGFWGRWNAHGPGTACLFRELDLGPNFTSWNAAKPGDFMKIFWNPNVGRHEHSQSVIFLGLTQESGGQMVHFWSSSQPYGYGERAVPKTKIASMIFSRLQNAQNIQRAPYTLSPKNVYLGSLITKDSSLAEALDESGVRTEPKPKVLSNPSPEPAKAPEDLPDYSALIVGKWRSPRHDYIYYSNGTWRMAPPATTYGTWRIEGKTLFESTPIENGEKINDSYEIVSLTSEKIVFKMAGTTFEMDRMK